MSNRLFPSFTRSGSTSSQASRQGPERKIRKRFALSLKRFTRQIRVRNNMATASIPKQKRTPTMAHPKAKVIPGRFGVYGGRYVPETLMAALEELEGHYEKARRDRSFQRRLDQLLRTYAGRPTALFFAQRLTQKLGGARIYLKREDLLHTGAHKINNCLGQGLLVER